MLTLPRPTHLLYLHGFRSSPQSTKARKLATVVAALQRDGVDLSWACPQLPPSPREAMAVIHAHVADWPHTQMAVIGSSLGGFYATVLANQLACQAVLINPAVAPARDLARYIGEQTSYHDPHAHFFFRPEFIDEFQALDPYPLQHPELCHALIAKGDEVLDWHEMVSHYQGARIRLLDGSDHAVSDFDTYLPEVLGWLDLPMPRP